MPILAVWQVVERAKHPHHVIRRIHSSEPAGVPKFCGADLRSLLYVPGYWIDQLHPVAVINEPLRVNASAASNVENACRCRWQEPPQDLLNPAPKPGQRFAESPEHGMHALRHFYASVLLDAGEIVKALSEYLGHGDPGFSLRTYTHLMPNSQARARRAVDSVFREGGDADDGPQTAQEEDKPS